MPKERMQHGRIMIRDAQNSEIMGGVEIPGAILVYEHDGESPIPETATTSVMPSLDLYWNRNLGEVQLSFAAPKEWFRSALLPDLLGDAVPADRELAVYSEPLSRGQINHMIRTLRRARDAAFGADA